MLLDLSSPLSLRLVAQLAVEAAHHAHTARGHVIHGRGHAEEAVKAHTEEHGKK